MPTRASGLRLSPRTRPCIVFFATYVGTRAAPSTRQASRRGFRRRGGCVLECATDRGLRAACPSRRARTPERSSTRMLQQRPPPGLPSHRHALYGDEHRIRAQSRFSRETSVPAVTPGVVDPGQVAARRRPRARHAVRRTSMTAAASTIIPRLGSTALRLPVNRTRGTPARGRRTRAEWEGDVEPNSRGHQRGGAHRIRRIAGAGSEACRHIGAGDAADRRQQES